MSAPQNPVLSSRVLPISKAKIPATFLVAIIRMLPSTCLLSPFMDFFMTAIDERFKGDHSCDTTIA